jgi:Concanavalin A-like lectin/glucanases superfamily/Purple acid Phosphatase, N-terminal domain
MFQSIFRFRRQSSTRKRRNLIREARTLRYELLEIRRVLASNWYVSPTGSPSGNGSLINPWSLSAALADNTSTSSPNRFVQAGDTIWLLGGTYTTSGVSSRLRGSDAAPILVKNYQDQRATINHSTGNGISVDGGGDVWFVGLEFTSTSTSRYSNQTGSNPSDIPYGAAIVVNNSDDVKIINCIIHDGSGLSEWSPGTGTETTGNLIYYSGWKGPDRTHGHGIYTQNQTGTKRFIDNMIFYNGNHGIHAYGSSSAHLNNFVFEGNTLFNNGELFPNTVGRNLLLGGGQGVHSATVQNNMIYRRPATVNSLSSDFMVGFDGTGVHNSTIRNNYVAGNSYLLGAFNNVDLSSNTFYGSVNSDTGSVSVRYPSNQYLSSRPTGTRVFLRPNPYDTNRANLTIYNWNLLNTVSVDVSTFNLRPGDQYAIRNALNYYGDVITGTYTGGQLNIPMTGRTVAAPAGLTAPPTTFPEFGAFVLTKVPGGGTIDSTPPVISNVAASSLTSTSAQFTWSTNEASDSRVEYGTTTSYGSSTPLDTAFVNNHVVNLTGLTAGTTYQYRVISRDPSGNLQFSGNYTFSTLNSTNRPPTLTSVNTLTGGVEDMPFSITYAQLAAAANETDPDNDTIRFRIESITSGSLTKNGVPATPGSTMLAAGETLNWIPPTDAVGDRPAFTLRASDGQALSAVPVQVTVNLQRATSTLPAGALANFEFNESLGVIANDSSGNGNTARLENGTTRVSINGGMALNFDGVNDHVALPNGLGLNITDHHYTLSARIKTGTTVDSVIMKKYGFSGSEAGFILAVDGGSNGGRLRLSIASSANGGAGRRTFRDTRPINDNQWHDIAVTVERGVATKFYVDGVLSSVDTTNNIGSLWNTDTFSIANTSHYFGGYFPGQIDNVRVFSRALSASEVASLGGGSGPIDTTPPVISNVAASNLMSTSVQIAWSTNEVSDRRVEYGTTTSYGSTTTLDTTLASSHIANLTGLTPATTYHYRVHSRDASGNAQISSNFTFNTLSIANRAPTLTFINTLTGGVEGVPFNITFPLLASAANEADPDNDPIRFRIESITNGNLTKNGVAVVPGTTLLASGETLVWIPPTGVLGDRPAFTVRASDGQAVSATPIQVSVTVQSRSTSTFPSGAIANFEFNEGTGLVANDTSGNGVTARLVNGAAWVSVNGGAAVNFDGANDHVTLPNGLGLNITDHHYTLSARIKTGTTVDAVIMKKYSFSGSEAGFILAVDGGSNGGRLRLFIASGANGGAGRRTFRDTKPVNDNQWHDIVVTVERGVATKFYVDGVLSSVDTSNNTGSLWNTDTFSIANTSHYFGGYFSGQIDNVRLFGRALSAGEVVSLSTSQQLSGLSMTSFSSPLSSGSLQAAPSVSSANEDSRPQLLAVEPKLNLDKEWQDVTLEMLLSSVIPSITTSPLKPRRLATDEAMLSLYDDSDSESIAVI